ncbi:disease resistance protein RPV1-like [Quercus suber]|uniref:disease resistance protein RPV1-like n=1 Tax=Quercus suber TaxID=58331 RepID=UPI000CE285D9|nr:TMV resistance protein N-like [Quercus suber]XP_023907262.1 TMV resistance protein N-like [Quercus suber]
MTFEFQEPSSSSSSSSDSHQWTHDVFLSFRGTDTRNNFTGHLYNALHKKGINTFIDDELRRGEEISPALLKAIEGSRISILILSKNYASSSWCLDELLKILECKETKEQMVLPVFFKVDPSDIRDQSNCFGKAFDELRDKVKNDARMRKWKAALIAVSNLTEGWRIDKGNESELIQEIVQRVSLIVNRTYLNVAKYPVGIEPRVHEVNSLLSIGSNDIRMVGILGIGGIGKTTIAKAIYNLLAYQFDGSCFLANIGETSKQESGLVRSQETLLSEILRDTGISQVGNVNRGINVIKQRLRSKRILLFLDGVDKLVQLETLAGNCDWFGLGSRIIITTREKALLANHEVGLIYQVRDMDDNEALQLFSWNAFKTEKPFENYDGLTERAILYARGLPLVLTNLGSELYGRTIVQWKSALDKYEAERKRKRKVRKKSSKKNIL